MLSATYKLQTEKEQDQEKKHKRIAFAVSMAFYAVIFLICILFALHPPDPPLPDVEIGMEMVFGEDVVGKNNTFEQPAPSNSQPQPEEVVEKITPPQISEPVKYETSNESDAPVVKETKKDPVVDKPVQEERKVDKRALFEKNTGTSGDGTNKTGSKGTGDVTGNQGDPKGDKDATNWKGGLGDDGSGFSLAGRNKVSLPLPHNPTNQGGIITVEINVDRNGNVISARPGVTVTTLANNDLWEICRQTALKAKFTPKADAPEIQVGKIRYNFKLE